MKAVQELFWRIDPAIWLLTSCSGERRGGLIASHVSQASIVPDLPRLLVGLSCRHYTRELVEESAAFALHLLCEEQLAWVWRFGLESGRDVDKLDGLTVRNGKTGSPILEQAIGWLDCRVEDRLECGDRTVYLAEVVDGEILRDDQPLTLQQITRSGPEEKLAMLHALLERDSARDAGAIREWRERRGPGAGGKS